MRGHIFIAPGSLPELSAHAIAFSANNSCSRGGQLYWSFQERIPGFAEWLDSLRAPLLTDAERNLYEVGTSFWMPLDGQRQPHGVALVIAGGDTSSAEHKAALAVRGALRRAVSELRALGRTDRLLIALPGFRVGQGGDRQQRLRSARVQVATAQEELERLPGVDVAFVLYTPTLYQIYLEARRQVEHPARDGGPENLALEEAVAQGECVLFAGAGLSRGAGLPDWSELLARLGADLGLAHPERHDYLDLAQWHRERFGGAALAQVVRDTFGSPTLSPKPTLAHYLLLGLPVRHVLTTNYDGLLETTLTALKKQPVKIVKQEQVALTGDPYGVHVVKLHGDAADAEEIVLSRDDYDEFFQRRPALAVLLEGLLLNRTFFFVGYSLRDPNFRQIYARIARMLREARRPAFATTFERGEALPFIVEQWRRKQLTLLPIPGETGEEQGVRFLAFLDRLAERVTLAHPRLFLATDVELPPRLVHLRKLFLNDIAPLLVRLIESKDLDGSGRDVVQPLVNVLDFLTDHGWRPAGGGDSVVGQLWERLAGLEVPRAMKRQLLITALSHAEAERDASRIRTALDHLDE
jgi:hypothetical protein